MDILTKAEAADWLRLDYEDPVLASLIQSARDLAEGCIDGFAEKLKNQKFRRKLKLFMLNTIVTMYEQRGVTGGAEEKMRFVNSTLLMQLQYGVYTEVDV